MERREILPQIKATSRHEKYSENLMKWLRKQKEAPFFAAISTSDGVVYDPAKTQASRIFIGRHRIDEKGFLFGSRLSNILCTGSRTDTFAFVPSMKFVIIPDWWEGYIRLGKCFIDPEHTLYYDRERWEKSDDGKTRECVWCGNHGQYLHTEMVPRQSWRTKI